MPRYGARADHRRRQYNHDTLFLIIIIHNQWYMMIFHYTTLRRLLGQRVCAPAFGLEDDQSCLYTHSAARSKWTRSFSVLPVFARPLFYIRRDHPHHGIMCHL